MTVTPSLFRAGSDPRFDAMLHFPFGASIYAMGYLNAAEALVERVKFGDNLALNTMVYPIVFLYRQYLELQLKSLRIALSKVNGEKIPETLTHHLPPLWTYVRPRLEKALGPSFGTTWLDDVEKIVQDFETVDPSSQEFRYATRRDGLRSLSGQQRINVVVLADALKEPCRTLDIAYGLVEDLLLNMRA